MTAPTFRLNGASLGADEPHPFLDQAHAVTCLLEEVFDNEEPNGWPTIAPEIVRQGIRAVESLLIVAGMALERMEEERAIVARAYVGRGA